MMFLFVFILKVHSYGVVIYISLPAGRLIDVGLSVWYAYFILNFKGLLIVMNIPDLLMSCQGWV
ncbi:MAG: hypothetical protein R6W85_02320 [Gillisia sp.]